MNKTQTVIDVLMSGEELGLKQIAEKVSEVFGKETKVQEISGLMTRMSDKERCDLGHFIRKNKNRGAFAYKIVHEALALSGEQAYGLHLKTGKDKYTLGQAVEDHPALGRFVNPDDLGKKPGKRGRPKAEKKTIATKKAIPSGTSESVYEIIQKSRDGASIETLAKQTNLDDDNVFRILLKLRAQGKVVRAAKGKYKTS